MKRHVYVGAITALNTMFIGRATATPSIAVAYCASINTATTAANSSTFQSEGLCYNFCNDDGYALGVLQDSECWCSNYVPDSGDQVDTSKCTASCPGYPSDYCGGNNLYGYIKLSASVSGTAGGSTSTAEATTSTTSTSTTGTTMQVPTRAVTTVTETLQASVTTSSSSSDDSTTTSTSLTSSQSAETTSSTSSAKTTETTQTTTDAKSSATIITSVQTVTSEGSVTTQTIVTTAFPKANSNSGISKGAVAGLVIGILAAIAAFVAGAILYRRHRKNQQHHEAGPLSGAMAGSHRRGSSAGIMSKTGTMSSSGYGLPMDEDMSYASPGRRMSMKPMDPRLDPKQTFGLYRAASHDSINTIRDDHDYSRRVHEAPRIMRVTNPDPE